MKQIFLSMPIKWRKVVLDNLKIFEENELIEAVSSK
jgi:hypothetical protein